MGSFSLNQYMVVSLNGVDCLNASAYRLDMQLVLDTRENQADPKSVFAEFELKKSTFRRQRNDTVYAQGDSADAIFWLQDGHVKLTIVSDDGKEAVVAILGPGEVFGEACLAGQLLRNSSATGVTRCLISRVARDEMLRALKTQPALSQFLLSQILSRKIDLEADLADHLCHSCERRLARTLLLLTRFTQSSELPAVVPKINQETLAAMIGTTQPRISYLLHKFKEQGLIEHGEGLRVNSSLVRVLLREKSQRQENCQELSNFE